MRIGHALADVATIGLLQERNLLRSETIAEQLQAALSVTTPRNSNQRLTDVAQDFVASPGPPYGSDRRPSPHPVSACGSAAACRLADLHIRERRQALTSAGRARAGAFTTQPARVSPRA